jgi:uncharacterized membrane protein YgcG
MTVRLSPAAAERLDAVEAVRAASVRDPRGPLDDAVVSPMTSLDLEDLGLEVDIAPEQLTALLEKRAEATTQVLTTVDRITVDLDRFRPLVPVSLPASINGTLLNPDGSPAAQVRVRALEPSGVATTGSQETFSLTLPWPNPEVITDSRGGFRLALPPRLLPDDGLTLLVLGANRSVDVQLRRVDLVAGDGALGVLALDSAVAPLPRSVLAQLGDVVRPTSDEDVLANPDVFAEPAPVITLGDADCAVSFQSNSGVIDKFGYSMLVRLVAPELSGRRLGSRVGREGRRYLLSASSVGLTRYVGAASLIEAMNQLGTWELVGRVPVEAPIDVGAFLDAVQRDPRSVPKAATLGIGYVVKMHQLWVPSGMSLGDLVYSLPLAPGEQQRIAVADERETLSVREQETLTAEEFQRYQENADSSTNAVFSSAFDESARGGSTMKTSSEAGSIGGGLGIGGFFSGIVAGLGIAGGYSDSTTTGSSSSWQTASRDYVSNASQDFHSSLGRAASARRSANRTSVRLATATERKEVVTKVITNHNHNHALTMQYWQVLRHYRVSSQVDDVQLVCFVPLEVVQFLPSAQSRTLPTGSYSRDQLLQRYGQLLRHHDVIQGRVWWRPELAHGLRMLRGFAGDPTMTVQSSSGAAQDIVNLSLAGTFLPFEDVWVTAVSTSGARVGPVLMTGTSASVAAGATTKAGLLDTLRNRRSNPASLETRTAALSLPSHVSRSNLARFEFRRAFRPFSYQLTMPSDLSFGDLIAYLNNASKLQVSMAADELERELSGPLVADPTASIIGPPVLDVIEDFNGAGLDVMPALMPVAAKRLAPQLAFADLLRIEALLQHVVENTVDFSLSVWKSLTAEERAIMLERFTIGVPSGGVPDATDEVPLLNCVANQVLGYFGNAAIMPFFIPPGVAEKVKYTSRDVQESLLRFHRQSYRPAQSSITLPARGVLGEAVLGHCESSEKIDLTRFWNWQDSPPDQATDPAAVAGLFADPNALVGGAGAQAPAVLQPGGSSMVTINQGPAALTPADLASALIKGQPASNLPTDLTGITQLGAQMKVQTETTAESLNKTIAEASGLAKEAMKQIPEAIKAKSDADAAREKKAKEKEKESGGGTGGTSGTGTGTGTGTEGSGGSTEGGGGTSVASLDGGTAPIA